jgi:branched-chain amino acid transport system substrate-binding protein
MKLFVSFLSAAFAALFSFSFVAAEENDEVKLGLAGPLTGPTAVYGEQMIKGAEKAVADINAAGGVLGKKVILEKGDDVCEPKQAPIVARNMIANDVKFVIGHFCSGATKNVSKIYDRSGVVHISPGSTAVELSQKGYETFFRVIGHDLFQGRVASKHIMDNFKGKNIAVAHDNQAYSKGLANVVIDELEKAGVQLTIKDTITKDEVDYSAFVSKLKAANIDLLYYGGYHNEAGIITRQLREQGSDAIVMGGDALTGQSFWDIAGSGGQGTLVTFPPNPADHPATDAAANLVKYYRDELKYEPEGYTLYTYAAVQVWAQAVEKAQSFDTEKVIAALRSNTFETVLGQIEFDENGDVKESGYVVHQWNNGKLEILK